MAAGYPVDCCQSDDQLLVDPPPWWLEYHFNHHGGFFMIKRTLRRTAYGLLSTAVASTAMIEMALMLVTAGLLYLRSHTEE